MKILGIPITDGSIWLFRSLVIGVILFAATSAYPRERSILPLLGIQFIEDRSREYPEWDVPQGYDMTMMFGTYQVDVVRECSSQVAARLRGWADHNVTTLVRESDEPNRLIVHANLPEYGGIIEFLYRVFRDPPRARFTAGFIDRRGLRKLTSELGTELNERFRITKLASEVRRDMRCLGKSTL